MKRGFQSIRPYRIQFNVTRFTLTTIPRMSQNAKNLKTVFEKHNPVLNSTHRVNISEQENALWSWTWTLWSTR